MNTIHGRAKFEDFQILLESECSWTISMGSLVGKLKPEEYYVVQWHT